MDLSVFLAKLLGLYLVIVVGVWFLRKKQVESSSKEIYGSRGLLAVTAIFNLLFGLMIAIDHSIWELDWKGLITLLGYLSIVKGILRLGFPAHIQKISYKMMGKAGWFVMPLLLLIGIYLTYSGFLHS